MMSSWLSRIFVLIMLVGIAACGAATPAAQSAKQKSDVADISGVWTGTIRVTPCDRLASNGRCNAVNNVTFTLDQDGSVVTGKYACASGNTLCRHGGADDAGTVNAGSVSGNQLNLAVEIPSDGSKCYYSADTASSNRADGVYVCYQGEFPAEQGVWSATRQAHPSAQFAANSEAAKAEAGH